MSGNNNDSDSGDARGVRDWRNTAPKNVRAQMPAERHAAEYNMRHPKRGYALIFNHEFFDDQTLTAREGTNVDADNLTAALQNLRFDVKIFKDFKLKEMLSKIEQYAALDHSQNDCILIAILSHGELGYIFAKDIQYKLDNIWGPFVANRCPTLSGKPKLFFVQACQGHQQDGGVTLVQRTETDSGGPSLSYKIPTHADFLIAYSTVPGFYSWRNINKGSWFMQSLCAELHQNGKHHDILTLLTFVCQRVAFDFGSNTPDCVLTHQQKQIPCITTMLTRLLRFHDRD